MSSLRLTALVLSVLLCPALYEAVPPEPAYPPEQQALLDELAALEHYDAARAERYLAFLGDGTYSAEQVLRLVNTDNDLVRFEDTATADLSAGTLVLVNKYHPLPEGYVPEGLTDVEPLYSSAGGRLNEEANAAFNDLVEALWAEEGLHLLNASPYRSEKTQRALYARYCARDGQQAADRYSARPGYSEHQTGLALDVVAPGGTLADFYRTAQFEWMSANAHRFGFILRYGDGVEYLTGYKYEPWHYRYVGVEAASAIREEGLTLEEYYAYYVAPTL